MAKEDRFSVVSKLRFPEFATSKGWSNWTLKQLLKTPATYGIVTAGDFQAHGTPMVRGGDIKEGKIGDGLPLVSREVHFQYKRTILQEGDVVIALVGYPGEAAVVPTRYFGANISRAVGLLRASETVSADFLALYLNSPVGRASVLKPSAGSAQVVVNLKHLNELVVPVPEKEGEQHKIAACLTSLDELIAAQGRKVDALKTYKRGLMQQLFPREGESVPRLRFPEFRDAPKWQKATIGSRSKSFSGGTPETANKSYYGGAIPFIRSAEIEKYSTELSLTEKGLKNSAAKLVEPGDVLVALYGANSGDLALAKIGGAINQAILCLRPDGSKQFLYHFLTANKAWILATYVQGGQGNLSGEIIKSIAFQYPSEEEEKAIADCLSTLDAHIATESIKLDALRAHRKGLMQQLFPARVKV